MSDGWAPGNPLRQWIMLCGYWFVCPRCHRFKFFCTRTLPYLVPGDLVPEKFEQDDQPVLAIAYNFYTDYQDQPEHFNRFCEDCRDHVVIQDGDERIPHPDRSITRHLFRPSYEEPAHFTSMDPIHHTWECENSDIATFHSQIPSFQSHFSSSSGSSTVVPPPPGPPDGAWHDFDPTYQEDGFGWNPTIRYGNFHTDHPQGMPPNLQIARLRPLEPVPREEEEDEQQLLLPQQQEDDGDDYEDDYFYGSGYQ
jgi:hypothetical protein